MKPMKKSWFSLALAFIFSLNSANTSAADALVQTGEKTSPLVYVGILLVCLAAVIVLVRQLRKMKK